MAMPVKGLDRTSSIGGFLNKRHTISHSHARDLYKVGKPVPKYVLDAARAKHDARTSTKHPLARDFSAATNEYIETLSSETDTSLSETHATLVARVEAIQLTNHNIISTTEANFQRTTSPLRHEKLVVQVRDASGQIVSKTQTLAERMQGFKDSAQDLLREIAELFEQSACNEREITQIRDTLLALPPGTRYDGEKVVMIAEENIEAVANELERDIRTKAKELRGEVDALVKEEAARKKQQAAQWQEMLRAYT